METQKTVANDHGAAFPRGWTNEQPPIERIAVSAPEAARMLGIGTRLLWSLTNRGELPCVRLGRRVLYSVDELRRLLAERTGKAVSK